MRFFATANDRETKARKIEAVLCDFLSLEKVEGQKILDLGCGSGHIAEHFSGANDVIAADVVDQLTVATRTSFRFQILDGLSLPFADDGFDIVILNHVLAVVRDQLRLLAEIHRVLRRGGVCYFASANRCFPIEGATRLPLLHYLPGGVFRALYKRILRCSDDLFPVGYRKLRRLIRASGFAEREYTADIINNPDKYGGEYTAPFGASVLKCISPTVVFVLRK